MKKISIFTVLFFALSFLLTSCGRKAGTDYLPDAKKPKFDNVSDEL
jgi:predicted small lipoprotein YifL